MSKQELAKRYLFFVAGLFVNSLGISLITKAEMGTSPISSIPYTLSIGFAPSLGMFTLFYSLLLICLQLVILRSRFPKEYWLQIPVSLGFSYFIDLTMGMLDFLNPQGYLWQLVSLLIGCVVLGVGVFMEMAANVVMLPGECTVQAISSTLHTDFGKSNSGCGHDDGIGCRSTWTGDVSGAGRRAGRYFYFGAAGRFSGAHLPASDRPTGTGYFLKRHLLLFLYFFLSQNNPRPLFRMERRSGVVFGKWVFEGRKGSPSNREVLF